MFLFDYQHPFSLKKKLRQLMTAETYQLDKAAVKNNFHFSPPKIGLQNRIVGALPFQF
jgi:hypothetical protein